MSSADDAVTLVVPGRAEYLRLVRLAAADCGARAGLSIEEVEDLRIAVDELAYALFGDDRGTGDLQLRYSAAAGVVEVEGECATAANSDAVPVAELSRTIIEAVADEHEIIAENGTRRFRLVKRAQS